VRGARDLRSLAHRPRVPHDSSLREQQQARCGVIGALIFSLIFSLQFRLRILPEFSALPFELLLALPYLVVIGALALSGRNVAYPGAYLKPYRRS